MLGELLSHLIGVVIGALIPAYFTYKAVIAKDPEEYMRWMKYWCIYGFFLTIEAAMDLFIFWLPLYYEAKVVFRLFLVLPQFKGSDYVFKAFVLPTIHPYEPSIDALFAQLRERTHLAGMFASVVTGAKSVLNHAVATANAGEVLPGDEDIEDETNTTSSASTSVASTTRRTKSAKTAGASTVTGRPRTRSLSRRNKND